MNTQKPENPRQEAMKEKQAAAYIGMSVPYLRADRMNGYRKGRTPGPTFVKIGRTVRYLRKDLDAWLQTHRVEREQLVAGQHEVSEQDNHQGGDA